MTVDTNTKRTLVAIGAATTYAELRLTTGLRMKALTNIVAGLKRRGLVERVGGGGPGRPSVLRITPSGIAAIEHRAPVPAPRHSLVKHALRARHPLATIWMAQCGCP